MANGTTNVNGANTKKGSDGGRVAATQTRNVGESPR